MELEDALSRLSFWCANAESGMACVVCIRPETRQRLIEGLQSHLQKQVGVLTLERHQDPLIAVETLRKRLHSMVPESVLCVQGWEEAFYDPSPRAERLYTVNLNRETLSEFPIAQVWLFSAEFLAEFQQGAFDTYTWFRLILEVETDSEQAIRSANQIEQSTEISLPSLSLGIRIVKEGVLSSLTNALAQQIAVAVQTFQQGNVQEALRLANLLLTEHSEIANLQSSLLHLRGLVYFREGQYELAKNDFELALEIEREPSLHRADILISKAEAICLSARPDEAQPLVNLAMVQYSESKDTAGLARAFDVIGTINHRAGRWEDAIKAYNESSKLYREMGDRLGEAASLHGLANVYNKQGRWEDAIKAYNESIEIKRILGNRLGEATSLHGLANVYNKQGRWEDAIKAYNESIETKHILGNRLGEAASQHGLANVYDNQGRWEDAIRAYNESIVIERILGNRYGEAASLHGLANVYAKKGQWEDAIKAYNESIGIKRILGNRLGEAASQQGLANVYNKQGRWEDAIKAYNESGTFHMEIGDRLGEAVNLGSKGTTLFNQGKVKEAINAYRDSVAKLLTLGDFRNAAIAQYGIALVLYINHDVTTAKQEVEKSIDLYIQTEDQTGLKNALDLLGKITKASSK